MSLNHSTQFTGQLRNQIDQYNMMLTALDSAKAEIETLEKTIRETSERFATFLMQVSMTWQIISATSI